MDLDFDEVTSAFCADQARNISLLKEAELAGSGQQNEQSYPELERDILLFHERIQCFLFEVSYDNSALKRSPNQRVCEVLNRVVLNKPEVYNAINRLSRHFNNSKNIPTHSEMLFAFVLENFGKGIFEMSRTASKLGQVPEIERYQAGLALVKFTQMTNSKRKETVKKEQSYSSCWDEPLNSASDVRITATRAGTKTPKKEKLRPPETKLSSKFSMANRLQKNKDVAQFSSPEGPEGKSELALVLDRLTLLEASLDSYLRALCLFLEQQIYFAQAWFEFLGNHDLDYGFRQYIEKCNWQREFSQTVVDSLLRIRRRIAELSLILRSEKPILTVTEVEEALAILSTQYVMVITGWYQQMAIGDSGGLWDGVLKFYEASIMATDRCVVQYDKTLFERSFLQSNEGLRKSNFNRKP